jgi:hypothetical protein
MKNHSVHIMHSQQALSPVFYMWGFSMENLQRNSKHLVAMNFLSSNMIPSSARLLINLRCSTLISVVKLGLHFVCNSPCHSSLIKIPPPTVHLLDMPHKEYVLVMPWGPPKS